MLLVTLIGTFFTVYGVLRPTPLVARLKFSAGVKKESGGILSFATPKPGDILPVRLSLTPYNQDLGHIAIVVAAPPSATLISCYYSVDDGKRRSCEIPDGEARADLARLGSGQTLHVAVRVEVEAPAVRREGIVCEMSSTELSVSRREVDLYPTDDSVDDRLARVGH
jgi:hypothetical protein